MALFSEIEIFETEEIMSVNHSRTIQRMGTYLERYNDLYDILPELEMKLNGKPVKPDISVYPHLPEDWDTDIIFLTEPPIIAIEVLSFRTRERYLDFAKCSQVSTTESGFSDMDSIPSFISHSAKSGKSLGP